MECERAATRPMDQNSYWHDYFMARHHTDLTLGIVLMSMALIFAVTGRCLVKYQGIVSRAKDPKTFWQNVALYALLGLVFLGLYVYTLN
jgi:hypothetical protein